MEKPKQAQVDVKSIYIAQRPLTINSPSIPPSVNLDFGGESSAARERVEKTSAKTAQSTKPHEAKE